MVRGGGGGLILFSYFIFHYFLTNCLPQTAVHFFLLRERNQTDRKRKRERSLFKDLKVILPDSFLHSTSSSS